MARFTHLNNLANPLRALRLGENHFDIMYPWNFLKSL
jgi:hypothetical protein